MQDEETVGEHLRLKIVETLVRIEHLPIMSTDRGLIIFGRILEMSGRCCTHVSQGHFDEALKVAKTVGRSVPHAFDLGPQRQALEDALEDLIAVLELPEMPVYH